MISASRSVGTVLKNGDIVVYESTVYPGAVEEECVPVLAETSGLKRRGGFHGRLFARTDQSWRQATSLRIDHQGRLGAESRDARYRGRRLRVVVVAGIHRAPSIRVAEAAKVIENTQRDLNIAFMNELSLIFQALNIDTGDVLAAARTKWNFMPFQPGLVGGHCIGVDPYYLTYRAEKAGYHPEVILAGRRINDGMGQRMARECVRGLLRRKSQGGVVTMLGLTFKEDVPDTRNSRVIDIVRELHSFGLTVQIHDPLANAADAKHEYDVTLTEIRSAAACGCRHSCGGPRSYVEGGWPLVQRLLRDGSGLVLDVKMKLDRAAKPAGIELWRL